MVSLTTFKMVSNRHSYGKVSVTLDSRRFLDAPLGCSMRYHIGRSSQGLAPAVPDSSATSNLPL